jgi:hypothetical protein
MKKLNLDSLAVESFATSSAAVPARGTVAGHEAAFRGFSATCRVSWDGTCYITCGDTCFCETVYEC